MLVTPFPSLWFVYSSCASPSFSRFFFLYIIYAPCFFSILLSSIITPNNHFFLLLLYFLYTPCFYTCHSPQPLSFSSILSHFTPAPFPASLAPINKPTPFLTYSHSLLHPLFSHTLISRFQKLHHLITCILVNAPETEVLQLHNIICIVLGVKKAYPCFFSIDAVEPSISWCTNRIGSYLYLLKKWICVEKTLFGSFVFGWFSRML